MINNQTNQNETKADSGYMSINQLDMNWGHSDYGRNAKDEVVSTIQTKAKAYIKGYQGGRD